MKGIINLAKTIAYTSFATIGVLSAIGGLTMGILMVSVCKNESERRKRE